MANISHESKAGNEVGNILMEVTRAVRHVLRNGLKDVCEIAAKKKLLLATLTALFVTLQISLIFAPFWMRMGFEPISINTGIYFSRAMMAFLMLPVEAPGIIYATRGNMAVIITPNRLIWIVLLSLISALYLITVMHYRKNVREKCRIINPGIVSVGVDSLGSVVSTMIIAAIGCPSCTTLLFLPLVGGVLISTFGAILSAANFIGLLSATVYIGSKINIP